MTLKEIDEKITASFPIYDGMIEDLIELEEDAFIDFIEVQKDMLHKIQDAIQPYLKEE